MNKITMLNYCKLIITKVSFNEQLFWKEYNKSLEVLDKYEGLKFREWVKNYFQYEFYDYRRIDNLNQPGSIHGVRSI